MVAGEILRAAMKEKKVTQTKLAEMVGYNTQSGLASRLTGKINCDLFAQILNALDYEVVVQPKTQGKRKEGSIVLEPSGLPDGRGKRKSGAVVVEKEE